LREFERVRSDLDDVRGLKRGNVEIAVVQGVVSNFLFSIVAKFGAQFPDVTFDVDVAGTGEILNSVAQDDADLGIAFNPVPHPDVETHVEVQHPSWPSLRPIISLQTVGTSGSAICAATRLGCSTALLERARFSTVPCLRKMSGSTRS
jgi:LysR substrate binding domain